MSDNQELLKTTSLKDLVAVRAQSTGPIEKYSQIFDEIRARCGSDVASLFSEPARPAKPEPDNPQLTWYTNYSGNMVSVAGIDDVARRPVVSLLRQRLRQLKPILTDPDIGAIVASWLYVASPNDILSVGGQPVLINWGHLPKEVVSAAQREAHFASTIGRFAPDIPVPPFSPEDAAAYSARLARPVAQSTEKSPQIVMKAGAAGLGPTLSNAPLTIAAADKSNSGRAPLVATAIAAIIFVILLIPGVLLGPQNGGDAAEVARQADILKQDNAGLRDRLVELESAARDRVCRLPNGRLAPLDTIPGGRSSAPVSPRADPLAPPPSQVPVQPNPNAPSSPSNLTELLDRGSVFIFGSNAIGSGFFVTPDRIVTNRHVIEGMDPQSIRVTNKAMGKVLPARVVARSPPESKNSFAVQDLAVLAVSEPGPATLKLGPTAPKQSLVIAIGYPGYIVTDDPGFQRLLRGDATAAPDNVVYPGVVIQKRETDPVKLVTHSANLGKGNSGGPLTDYCGRVVGVNTWVKNEGKISTAANFAQDVRELQAFLTANGIATDIDDAQRQCPPPVVAAAPTTPPPAAVPARP